MGSHPAKSIDRKSGMEPARAGFHKIVSEILRRAPAEDAALIGWRLVCGATVSERTTALDFRDGVLCVEVPDAAWRAQLRDFTPEYLASLNQMLNVTVERVDFVLPGVRKPASRA